MGVMTGSSTAPPRNCTVHRVATRSAALLGSAGSEDQLSIAGENAGARRAPCAFLRGGTGRPPIVDTRALPSRARGRWLAGLPDADRGPWLLVSPAGLRSAVTGTACAGRQMRKAVARRGRRGR